MSSLASIELPAAIRAPDEPGPSARAAPRPGHFRRLTEFFLFEDCLTSPDLGRRARLVAWFGLLGFAFGNFYAAFYIFIGHQWGVGIVAVGSLLFLAAPFLMKHFRSVSLGGNFLAAVMTLGFTGLCYVEGGLEGHAVTWLASVPLCALLLIGRRAAGAWVIISFAAAASVVAADLAEIPVPLKYYRAWKPFVDSTGYLGLIAFLFGLGLIFEKSREQAFDRMTGALLDLESSNEKLSALNREKTEFLGIAAHDLRNPLTVIISYADVLREGGPSVDATEFAGVIFEAGARMRDLITNLLDANAIEEGRVTYTIESCAVDQLITQNVAQNQLHATRKETEVIVTTERNLRTLTDRSTAIQILDNLISNALKYAPPQTRVFVVAMREGQRCGEPFYNRKAETGRGFTVADTNGNASGYARAQLEALGGGFAAVDPHLRYDADVRTELPQRASLGAEWQALDRLRLVGGIDWINWADAFDQLAVHLTNGRNVAVNGVVGAESLTDIVPLNWRDQFVFHSGAEFDLGHGLAARAGYSYARSPVPNDTLTPLTGAIFEHTITSGLGYRWDRYYLDLAGQFRLPAAQHVGQSALLDGEYSQTSVTVSAWSVQITTGIDF